jgi:hypothetical protein
MFFITYEIKETYEINKPKPPEIPRTYPWDTDYVFGVCYLGGLPLSRLKRDEAYQRALDATYYMLDKRAKKWVEIGDAEAFVNWIASADSFDLSWPDEYPNCRKFARDDIYDVYPYRELVRRHIDQYAYVTDRDMMILPGYRTP